jgi:methyl-accepting chemotaxis protein
MALRFKLILLTVGMVVLASLVNFVGIRRLTGKLRTDSVANVSSYAETLSKAVAAQFFERYGDVQAFALNDLVRKPKVDGARVTNLFNEYAKIYLVYDAIVLVDMNGNFIASNSHSANGKSLAINRLEGQNFSTAPWFKNAVREQYSNDEENGLVGTYVEDFHLDPISSAIFGEPRYGTSFSCLIKDAQGTPMGVISNRANFVWAEAEFQSMYAAMSTEGLTSVTLSLLNKEGTHILLYEPSENQGGLQVIHDPEVILKRNLVSSYLPHSEVTAGKSGSKVAFHPLKKATRVVGYASTKNTAKILKSLGWGVVVGLDEATVVAAATHAQSEFFWISLFTALIFSAISFFFSSRLSKQINLVSEEISNVSSQVLAGSGQMSTASQNLASSVTESASALEETVASIEELGVTVKRNAENAAQAAQLSRVSRQSADDGESEMSKLTEAMNQINLSSTKIEDINNVIDDIAFQTNLLALNAAVEAARAGDQGKGFAVVAEEVRNLAQRSAAAAKDINLLIKENVSRIEAGVAIAGKGGEALKGIVGSVRKVADLNGEIAAASQEQADTLDQIRTAMGQLDQVTQINAVSAEEVAAGAEQISNQRSLMEHSVIELVHIVSGVKSPLVAVADASAKNKVTPSASSSSSAKVIPMRSVKKTDLEKILPMGSEESGKLGNTSGF